METLVLISDLPTAAFLVCQKYPLIKTTFQGNRAQFFFEKTDNLELEVRDFVNQKTNVDALSFYRAFKLLKNIIHNRGSLYATEVQIISKGG